MHPRLNIALTLAVSAVVLLVAACSSGKSPSDATRPVPIDSRPALQHLADSYKDLAAKFKRAPMDMPPGERKAFVEQVFINAGYSYPATLHELATRKVDYSNQNIIDLADLLTMPHRNTESLNEAKNIYTPQEYRDIKVIEDRISR